MAINWSTGTGTNPHSVGLDVWLEGTLVKWRVLVRATYAVSQQQSFRLWGAASASGNYRKEGPGEQVLASGQFWGNRGQRYEFGAAISGIYGNNNNVPDVYNGVTVPALAPAPPSWGPDASDVNQSQATISWGPTSNDGGATPREDQLIVRRILDGVDVWNNTAPGNSRRIGGLEPNRQYVAFARIRNDVGWSEFRQGASFWTTQSAPPAPTIQGAPVGAGVGSKTLNWSNNPTSFAPYDRIGIERWDNVSQKWVGVASLGGSATSYVDSSVIGDRVYEYRIYAANSGGWSPYVYYARTDTTPTGPSNAAAEKSGANIVVSWTNNTRLDDYTTEIYESSGGGAYTLLASVGKGVTSWTHSSPSATVTHTYQVRTFSKTPVVGSAAIATSNTVQLAAPPAAPTITGPADARDATSSMVLTWRHNPVDSSPQRQRQIRYRVAGTTSWTTQALTTSSVQSATFAANTFSNGQAVEFQVLTYGQHATASPWSPTYTVTFSATPSVTLSTPTAAVTTPKVDVSWGYYQANGSPQAGYEIELLQGSTVRERRAGSGAASSTTLATIVPDASTWTVRIRVQSAAGIWSPWVSRTFSVSYPKPGDPLLGLLWDQETGSIAVGIDNVAPAAAGTGYTITNLATNPSFTTTTTGASATYGTGGAGSFVRVTSGGVDDGAFMRATWTSAPTGNSRLTLQGSNRAPTTVGTVYTLSVWVRTNLEIPLRLVAGRATAVSGGSPTADAGTPVLVPANVWTRLSYTFTATTSHVELRILTESANPATVGFTLDVDNAMVDESALLRPYHDGATIGYTTRDGYSVATVWNGTANASSSTATYSPAPVTVGNDVYRRIDNGEWELIASGVQPNGSVTDRECAVAGTNHYRAVAWSALPSAAEGPVSDYVLAYDHERESVGSIWVSAGSDFSQVCQARYAVEIEDGQNRSRVINRYEGRRYGVEVSADSVEHVLSASWTILPKDLARPGDAAWDDWLDLSALPGPHLYRDKAGRRFYGSLVGSGPRMKRDQDGTYRASMTIEETER